jgi:hypothetical protein
MIYLKNILIFRLLREIMATDIGIISVKENKLILLKKVT